MAGRPPKPTAIKVLQGNPGKRPLNHDEAQFTHEMPKCPTHVKREARREWKRVSQELYDAGLLESVDRAALAAYCIAYGRWVKATKELEGVELTLMTESGYTYPNPLLSIAKSASEEMRRYMADFGMTPASRAKVTSRKPEQVDPFEEWARKKMAESGNAVQAKTQNKAVQR